MSNSLNFLQIEIWSMRQFQSKRGKEILHYLRTFECKASEAEKWSKETPRRTLINPNAILTSKFFQTKHICCTIFQLLKLLSNVHLFSIWKKQAQRKIIGELCFTYLKHCLNPALSVSKNIGDVRHVEVKIFKQT